MQNSDKFPSQNGHICRWVKILDDKALKSITFSDSKLMKFMKNTQIKPHYFREKAKSEQNTQIIILQ